MRGEQRKLIMTFVRSIAPEPHTRALFVQPSIHPLLDDAAFELGPGHQHVELGATGRVVAGSINALGGDDQRDRMALEFVPHEG